MRADAAADEFPTPLPSDTPTVQTLPAKYPTSWSFLNYSGDLIELRNVGSDSRDVKGHLQAHDSATLLVADKRPELYVADTVWSRGSRGIRTDFITVYDTQTLNPIGEIVLPGTKRALITAMEGLSTFTDDQRMALVFNFTPRFIGDDRRLGEAASTRRGGDSGLFAGVPFRHPRVFDPMLERQPVDGAA